MAFKKQKTQKNGIVTNYHRIVSVNAIVNHAVIVEVCAYPSEDMRQTEKAALEKNEPFDVYTDTVFYSLEYDENFNVKKAYNWLKKHPDFEGAEDA